jgi:hypothetical protein
MYIIVKLGFSSDRPERTDGQSSGTNFDGTEQTDGQSSGSNFWRSN